jgi:endonuclease G
MRPHFARSAALFAALGGIALLIGLTTTPAGLAQGAADLPPPFPPDIHVAMGIPGGATEDHANKNNFLMKKPYFAVSYNSEKGIPNWVSWHLSKEYLGNAPRKPRFATDTTLPAGFSRIKHEDYSGSGFDRGHMCPHSDRGRDKTMSFSTFVMTNIVPQSHENNAGSWESLEVYGRFLAGKQEKDLFIVAGPVGQGGEGDSGAAETIAKGKVVVPEATWKIIMVVNRGEEEDPVSWVDGDVRLIAVIMPNNRSVPEDDWPSFRVPVAKVEQMTGLKFFTKAPAELIEPLKKKADRVRIPKLPKGQ